MTVPRLTGIGVGPGDPDLVTVKAVKVMDSADVVFVPVTADPPAGAGGSGSASGAGQAAGELGYAERIVLAHVEPGKVRRLGFVVAEDPIGRERSWQAAGLTVARTIADGGHAGFATIGDPNLYSTFTHLADAVRALVPRVRVDTVPGITAMQDLAARSGVTLAVGLQRLALLPLSAGPRRLAAALADFDTVVAYKGGRHLPRVREIISAAGRLDEAVFGARLGLDGEQIEVLPGIGGEPAPYLSTVIVTRPRGTAWPGGAAQPRAWTDSDRRPPGRPAGRRGQGPTAQEAGGFAGHGHDGV